MTFWVSAEPYDEGRRYHLELSESATGCGVRLLRPEDSSVVFESTTEEARPWVRENLLWLGCEAALAALCAAEPEAAKKAKNALKQLNDWFRRDQDVGRFPPSSRDADPSRDAHPPELPGRVPRMPLPLRVPQDQEPFGGGILGRATFTGQNGIRLEAVVPPDAFFRLSGIRIVATGAQVVGITVRREGLDVLNAPGHDRLHGETRKYRSFLPTSWPPPAQPQVPVGASVPVTWSVTRRTDAVHEAGARFEVVVSFLSHPGATPTFRGSLEGYDPYHEPVTENDLLAGEIGYAFSGPALTAPGRTFTIERALYYLLTSQRFPDLPFAGPAFAQHLQRVTFGPIEDGPEVPMASVPNAFETRVVFVDGEPIGSLTAFVEDDPMAFLEAVLDGPGSVPIADPPIAADPPKEGEVESFGDPSRLSSPPPAQSASEVPVMDTLTAARGARKLTPEQMDAIVQEVGRRLSASLLDETLPNLLPPQMESVLHDPITARVCQEFGAAFATVLLKHLREVYPPNTTNGPEDS